MSDLAQEAPHSAWDLELTRKLVAAKYGANQLSAMRPVLRAITTRLLHARIHFQDYQRLVSSHLEQPLENGTPWWELMWGNEEKDFGTSNYFFVASEGYVYACVQALHAIADNLAHVAYYVLGWNLEGRPPLDKVSLATLRSRLEQAVCTCPDLLPVQRQFAALATAPSYRALADVTNHIKHHGGLPVRVSWDAAEDAPYRVLLGSFVRNQEQHPQREISIYLEETHHSMSRAVICTGCALNHWLQENA